MLNQQIPLKAVNTLGSLILHSMFYTLQGEGPFAGEPAVFVRLGGCNLQCPMCDTEYTDGVRHVANDSLSLQVQALWTVHRASAPYPLVVITGGEPFRQQIGPLTRQLLWLGHRVQIETNGTLFIEDFPYDEEGVTLVCSPKAGKVNKHLEPHIDVYKYVLAADDCDPKDGLPLHALGLPGKVARPLRPHTKIFVNPMDEQDAVKNRRNLKAAVKSCMKYGYTLGIQLHKLAELA